MPSPTSPPDSPLLLGGRENGGHDDGAGMDRAALVGVVEVLAMRRGAVAQRRHRRTAAAGWPITVHRRLVGRRQRGAHEVARARRDAEAATSISSDADWRRSAAVSVRGSAAMTAAIRSATVGDDFGTGSASVHARFIPTSAGHSAASRNSRHSE